jgi:hypothetical protein
MNNPAKPDSKKEMVKSRIKMKTEMTENKSNKKTVQNLIDTHEKNTNIENIVNSDIDKQNENFKKLLEAKRNKSKLSTSDVTEQIDVLKNKRNEDEFEGRNKSFNLDNDLNIEEQPTGNILGNIDDSFEKIIDKTNCQDEDSNSFTLNETQIRNKKQKEVLLQLKGNTERFISQFNNLFYDDIFNNIVDDIEKLLNEKNEKKLEISSNYGGQIKEMEFLINSDGEETHKESIKCLIDSLKEEQDEEMAKLDGEFSEIIVDVKNKFRTDGLRKNPGVRLLEERFRLDMLNSINLAFKKNK